MSEEYTQPSQPAMQHQFIIPADPAKPNQPSPAYVKSDEATKMSNMSENLDKIQIKVPGGKGGGGGDYGASIAAVIAALGNRNETAGLAPLYAMMGQNRDGFGGIAGLALLAALFGRRGFGFGDGDGDHHHHDCCRDGERAEFVQSILNGIVGLTSAVPTTALETQNAIESAIAASTLANQQGFANVKDSVQGLALFLSQQLNNINQNVSDQGCRTRDTVQAGTTAVLTAIKDNVIAELQAQVAELRGHHHSRDTEFNITQSVNQQQAQGQQQQQMQAQAQLLNRLLCELSENTQLSRAAAANTNFIVGNQGVTATGPQSANPTATNLHG